MKKPLKMKSSLRYLLLIFIIPVAFFLPNMRPGSVMLPLDTFHHLQPFASSIPQPLENEHNSSLSDLITLYHPSIDLSRSSGALPPLWNPFSFLGAPALANGQNGTLFPLCWLFKVLSPGHAYILLALGKMWFCGFFAFLFFRKVGFRPLSSLLGSIGFMFCGHMIVWFGYPTSFPLSAWPFLMWALESYLEKISLRNIAWLSVGFGLLFIGGQPQTGFLISAAAALYLAVRSAQAKGRILKVWTGFAISGILGLCLAAPQIFPFLEYLRLSSASMIRSSVGHYGWKYYPWFTFISWMMPRFFGDVRGDSFWGFSSMLGEAVYIGIIPLVLAVIGFLSLRKGGNFCKSSLAVFLFGCFGLYIKPAAVVYLSMPLLSAIDNNKLVSMVAFGLIAFSVAGFERILTDSVDPRRLFIRYVGISAVCVLFAGFGFYYFRNAIRALELAKHEFYEGAWMLGLLLLGGTILWLLKNKHLSRKAAASIILLLTLGDVFRIWIYYIPSYSDKYLTPRSQALSYLQKNAGYHRIVGYRDMLPPQTSVLYRLQDMRGYDGMTPYTYYRVVDKIDPGLHDLLPEMQGKRPPAGGWTRFKLFYDSYAVYFDSKDPKVISDLRSIDYWSTGIVEIRRPALLSIFGVRYLLSRKGSDVPGGIHFKLVHQSDADVWENPNVLPRAYVVTNPIMVETDEAALEAVSQKDFPFDKTAVIAIKKSERTGASIAADGDGTILPAHIQKYDSSKIRVQAHAPHGGWLILSDLYYPGWEATCDGDPVEILAANYLLRAVQIPAGSHIIEYTYRPASFRIGCILGLLSGIVVVLFLKAKPSNSREVL